MRFSEVLFSFFLFEKRERVISGGAKIFLNSSFGNCWVLVLLAHYLSRNALGNLNESAS